METTERYGLIASGIGLLGIIFLLYRGTPLLSLQDIGGFGYYPAVLGYVFFILALGFGVVLLLWHRDAAQKSV
jgi:hypothetical protein